MIKRKWPKRVLPLGFHSSITPVGPEVRASLSLPRESDKERPGSPPDPRAGRQPSIGGCRPGPPAVRGGVRASTGPRVERVLPKALLPCGGRQPSPPAVRGGIWASATPWIGCKKWGPKGSLEPAGWPPLARKSFQPSAFRILSPFSALVVYSESGAQPSAIQTLLSRTRLRAPARPGCRAPRKAWRFAELPTALPGGERRLGTGRETSGGPSRSPPPLPFASEGARGPPRSIFGHFLLIKKVASGELCPDRAKVCRKILPSAQSKINPSGES